MDDKEREQALLTALTTEHFALQTSRGATIAESVGRATVFLTLLSASLVGLGFVSTSGELLRPYLAAVLPTLVVTGLLTFFRLVQNMVENSLSLQRLQRIRGFYHRQFGGGHDFFADAATDEDVARAAWRAVGGTPGRFQLLLTTAAMIGAVNALLLGASVTLLLALVIGSAMAITVGVLVVLLAFAAQFWWITRSSISHAT
ncbi:hypothetical protein V6U81_23710 [Micromonospora sp. CPCC 205711]|uniref:hypothetical protein n=1 Tax=Micromonospora sp. CPCC 205547 TaxID=3122400 RepID=UPI002FF1A053